MDAKLTLKLDKEVIDQAKDYAAQKGISLSQMVERYFRSLTRGGKEIRLSGVVGELAGILAGAEIDETQEGYAEYLAKKYS